MIWRCVQVAVTKQLPTRFGLFNMKSLSYGLTSLNLQADKINTD